MKRTPPQKWICLLKQRCVYALVFETPAYMDLPKNSKISALPHPFVIEPPLTTETSFPEGSAFDFNLLLFGDVNHNLPYFIYAIDQMGNIGIEIPDIVGESDNEHLLKKCLDLTFCLTKDPETAVFFSVAGGSCTDCFIDIQALFGKQDEITHLYRKVCGTRPLNEMSDTGITRLNADNFNSYKSKIKENLQKSFGLYALKELEIASTGTRPNTLYGISMDKAQIEIVY